MLTRGCALVLMSLVVAGCGIKENVVIVLPDQDGRVGSVVARPADGAGAGTVVDQAFAGADASRGGAVNPVKVEPAEVDRIFAQARRAQPTPPRSFTLYFVLGSDELVPESRAVFEQVFAEVARRPAPEIAVIGHTDRVGQPRANDVLSLGRAVRVRALLIERGIAADSIQAAGRGDREPLIKTADQVDEPRNRRVEISVR